MAHRWQDQFDEDMEQAALAHQQQLEQQRWEQEVDPNEDIDQANGQCICGKYHCKDSYVHWTSGW